MSSKTIQNQFALLMTLNDTTPIKASKKDAQEVSDEEVVAEFEISIKDVKALPCDFCNGVHAGICKLSCHRKGCIPGSHHHEECIRTLPCERCDTMGHIAEECRKPFCTYCECIGHTKSRCANLCRNQLCFGNRMHDRISCPRNTNCGVCNIKGHLDFECFKRCVNPQCKTPGFHAKHARK